MHTLTQSTRWWNEVDLPMMWPHLVANGCMAALLNVAVFVVLKETGAVTYGIAGQVKDWLNIFIAIPVFGNVVSSLQLKGYAIAVAMVFYYKHLREAQAKKKGAAAAAASSTISNDEAVRLLEAQQERQKAAHYSPTFDDSNAAGDVPLEKKA